MAIESSTFSPHRSTVADFTIRHGDDLLTRYEPLAPDVDWLPLVHARALPGGPVDPDFYLAFKAELLERLRAARPLDGLVLDIHGAMSVVGLIDAEADLATAVRKTVGPACLISAPMDPHGNMSRRLVDVLDLATSHRMSPHEDAARTRERAIANLVRCLRERIAPRRAWVRVPVLLAGERACTRDEPARGAEPSDLAFAYFDYGAVELSERERNYGVICDFVNLVSGRSTGGPGGPPPTRTGRPS